MRFYNYHLLIDDQKEEYLNWFIKGEGEVNQEYIDFMNHIKTIFIDKNK